MRYQVIITDVTDYGPQHCVAAWDVVAQRMVRLEPGPASFWGKQFVGPDCPLWPGHIVEFEAIVPANQPYPHATEDIVVTVNTLRQVDAIELSNLPGQVAGSVAITLPAIFRGLLRVVRSSAFVPVGSNCPSLGAIEIARASIMFSERIWDGRRKLRAHYRYNDSNLNLGITSSELRNAFFAGGLAGVGCTLPQQGRIHVRIGLSRPFAARPNECYVQINGIYPIPDGR